MRTGEACTSRKPKPGLGTLVNVNVALDHPAGLGVATVYNSSSVPLTERIPERSRHLCSGGGTAFSKTVTDEQERRSNRNAVAAHLHPCWSVSMLCKLYTACCSVVGLSSSDVNLVLTRH